MFRKDKEIAPATIVSAISAGLPIKPNKILPPSIVTKEAIFSFSLKSGFTLDLVLGITVDIRKRPVRMSNIIGFLMNIRNLLFSFMITFFLSRYQYEQIGTKMARIYLNLFSFEWPL